jgi:hypothetical protein
MGVYERTKVAVCVVLTELGGHLKSYRPAA